MPVKILMHLMGVMLTLLRSLCTDKSDLAMEVLALRQPSDSRWSLRAGNSPSSSSESSSRQQPFASTW